MSGNLIGFRCAQSGEEVGLTDCIVPLRGPAHLPI